MPGVCAPEYRKAKILERIVEPVRNSAMYRQWEPTSPIGPPSSSGRAHRQEDGGKKGAGTGGRKQRRVERGAPAQNLFRHDRQQHDV